MASAPVEGRRWTMPRFIRTPDLDSLDGIDDALVEAADALREAMNAGDSAPRADHRR